MNSIYFKKHLAFLLFFALVLAGCSKDSVIENPDADNARLTNFSLQKSSNPSLSSNIAGVSGSDIIYITVPEGCNLSSLVPTFKIGQGASVTINNIPVESGVTSCDLSNTSKLIVTSESGTTKTYTLLARNGDPKIDIMVYTFMTRHSLPGVSVAISMDEETVYKAGYGFSVVETQTRVTPQTLFRLASMSKQQTALAIMTLYENGKLAMDDKVFGKGGILEPVFGDEGILDGAKGVTVQHLLEHTSGWATDPVYPSNAVYFNKPLKDRVEFLIKNVTQNTAPGTNHDYNNLNFAVLGMIVEQLTGMAYEDYLAEYVHKPAGVKNIVVSGNTKETRLPNECVYYGQDGKDPYGNDMIVSKAAGGMAANVEELMKLMAAIDYGTKVPDILKKETLDLMYTPSSATNRYAKGWRVNYPYITTWGPYHGGTLGGTCTIWARGKNNVNGVVLCNSRSYNLSIDDDMWEMLEDIQKLFK